MAKPLNLAKPEPFKQSNQPLDPSAGQPETWATRTVRHTFYIDRAERDYLRELAKELGISQSELLRHGIKLVAKHGPPAKNGQS